MRNVGLETPQRLAEEETPPQVTVSRSRHKLNWLPQESYEIPLETRTSAKGQSFLFGTLIVGRHVEAEYKTMRQDERAQAYTLLRVHLPDFADGYAREAHPMQNPNTQNSKGKIATRIFYFKKGDTRVYFARLANQEDKPVIICIAMSDKSRQENIFKDIVRL